MATLEAQLRQEKILELLRQNGEVRVRELAHLLGVSEVTVRSDLEQMERKGLLKRLRGGAVLWHTRRLELPLEVTRPVHAREKEAIGKKAATLIQDKDVVILEGVHCEPPPDIGEDWAGCKRTCFLFWKEAWLERVADGRLPEGDR